MLPGKWLDRKEHCQWKQVSTENMSRTVTYPWFRENKKLSHWWRAGLAEHPLLTYPAMDTVRVETTMTQRESYFHSKGGIKWLRRQDKYRWQHKYSVRLHEHTWQWFSSVIKIPIVLRVPPCHGAWENDSIKCSNSTSIYILLIILFFLASTFVWYISVVLNL